MDHNGPTVMLTVSEIEHLHDAVRELPSTTKVHVWRKRPHPADVATKATLGDPSTSHAVVAWSGLTYLVRLDSGEKVHA
jgi:hypothetical protein